MKEIINPDEFTINQVLSDELGVLILDGEDNLKEKVVTSVS